MGSARDDPLPHLLNVSNSGGFRYRGSLDRLKLVVLTSSRRDPDWPDMLDLETGIYTYYGDNKRPGRGLHDTPRKGNELLRRLFELAHSGAEGRRRIPPVLILANTGKWRDVVFLGLARSRNHRPSSIGGFGGDLEDFQWRAVSELPSPFLGARRTCVEACLDNRHHRRESAFAKRTGSMDSLGEDRAPASALCLTLPSIQDKT